MLFQESIDSYPLTWQLKLENENYPGEAKIAAVLMYHFCLGVWLASTKYPIKRSQDLPRIDFDKMHPSHAFDSVQTDKGKIIRVSIDYLMTMEESYKRQLDGNITEITAKDGVVVFRGKVTELFSLKGFEEYHHIVNFNIKHHSEPQDVGTLEYLAQEHELEALRAQTEIVNENRSFSKFARESMNELLDLVEQYIEARQENN